MCEFGPVRSGPFREIVGPVQECTRVHTTMTSSTLRRILGVVEFGRRNLTADKQVSYAVSY